MKKVLCSLVMLAILVGMFVCLGVQAFADEGPKDLAVVAVADDALTPELIDRIKEDKQDCDVLVIDVNGLAQDQSAAGYSFVYAPAEQSGSDGFEYIWPGKDPVTREVTDAEQLTKCTVVLLAIGPEDQADAISAIADGYRLEDQQSVVIAIAPQGAAVDAAVQSSVDKVLTCGETELSDGKLIKVGGEAENPVSVLVVNESAGVDVTAMPLPQAVEKVAPATYTVTYEAQGGGGSQEQTVVTAGEGNYTFPECTFTAPEGMEFAGWDQEVDWTTHMPGDTLTISGDTTVTAAWREIYVEPEATEVPEEETAFTVTYKYDEAGTQADVVEQVAPDAAGGYVLKGDDTFTAQEKKKLAGWKSDDPADPAVLGVYNPYPLTKDVTFTALWSDLYTVSFEANGGSGEMEVQTVESQVGGGADFGLPACGFGAPEGQVFTGWKANDGTDTLYTPAPNAAVEYHLTGDVVFTAQWQATAPEETETPEDTYYTVSYAANQETAAGTMEPVSVKAGDSHTLLANAFTVEGMDFVGWSVNGGADPQQPGTNITVNGDVTVTAMWAAKVETFTVTYKANGGSGNDVVLEGQAKDTAITVLACDFTAPEGQSFAGWQVENGGDGKYEAGSQYTVTGNVTFLATWQPKTDEDPGATTTDMLTYVQGGTDEPSLTFANAEIATVSMDSQLMTENSMYTLSSDKKTVTFNNEYLDEQSTGTHVVSVTFQEGPNGMTYESQTRNLAIQAPPSGTQNGGSHQLDQPWTRSSNWYHDFEARPVSVEIYYGSDGYKTANINADYGVNGNRLTLYPNMVNGNWGSYWPNATYSFRVKLENGTEYILNLTLTGNGTATVANSPDANGQQQGGVPVTGNTTPVEWYIGIFAALIVALAVVVVIILVRRRNAGKGGQH